MIAKMSGMVILYVILTYFLWAKLNERKIDVTLRIMIGILYGALSILSTHFGVNYGNMMLNIRDAGPLAAGLFFHPVSGIIAGLIGGIERYFAGTLWNIGAYTTVACSISTILSGFFAAFMSIFIFGRARPRPFYCFFVGAVMEVFHMYMVFFTHSENITKAFYVVSRVCVPMIVFTAITLSVESCIILVMSGELINPFSHRRPEDCLLDEQFQRWLFLASALMFFLTFAFSYMVQTRSALEDARNIIGTSAEDIRTCCAKVLDDFKDIGKSEKLSENAEFTQEIGWVFTSLHVGERGSAFLVDDKGVILFGIDAGKTAAEVGITDEQLSGEKAFFFGKYNGNPVYYGRQTVYDRYRLFLYLPESEVYTSRNYMVYESTLGDILVYSTIFILISLLVKHIVVLNLQRVNRSLTEITSGNLDETVNVRTAVEFAALSDYINETVSALKGYIEDAKQRIKKELRFAKAIQESSLPSHFALPGMENTEMYAEMSPAREVGGDFYDFFFVGKDRLAIVIADVSGKGIPAALFMMRSKMAIRTLAESGSDPAETFSKVNSRLCEGNNTDMFVTAWLGIIDLVSGEMICANAGHEYPVVMRSGGEYELFKDRHSMPLAAMDGINFSQYEMKLSPGDRLFLYTDGVPEAINIRDEQYGTGNLLSCLNSNRNLSMEQTVHMVRQNIKDFVGEADQFDDITMLSFTILK
ncbi:MAG: SpoIIE family protein phosphatase [Lachnospiraceae bacterium]|nr:SpoIIE family protein phosphatase [Lachnospiraceae bacterium]